MKSTLTFDEQPATFFILQTSETKFLPLSLYCAGRGGEVQVV